MTSPVLQGNAFTISTTLPSDLQSASSVFSKYVDVFGLRILATSGVSDAKVLHTANVLAEYLDNDENGVIDQPEVLTSLLGSSQSTISTMVLFSSEAEQNSLDSSLAALETIMSRTQNLFADEIFEDGSQGTNRDATLEEVLHLVTDKGWDEAFPSIWGEKKGSSIANAMDTARGGYFETVPASYPANAWYTYDDQTADYGTQITEYVYWATTTYLGGQNWSGRVHSNYTNEWTPITQSDLNSTDPAVVSLLSSSNYKFPVTQLPDGNYTVPSIRAQAALTSNSGWKNSTWLGYFYDPGNNWIYHQTLGWLYPVDSGSDGVWFYHSAYGWMWTHSTSYPWIYFYSLSGWRYFLSGKGFYEPSSSSWIAKNSFSTNQSNENSSAESNQTGQSNSSSSSFTYDPQSHGSDSGITNAGFETNGSGWQNLAIGNYPIFSPVEGSSYAKITNSSGDLNQTTSVSIEAGSTYYVTAWARSIYSDSRVGNIKSALLPDSGISYPAGTTDIAKVTLSIGYSGQDLNSSIQTVSPVDPSGDAAGLPNDDGANVWIDNGYRMQFSTNVLYQQTSSNPITEAWIKQVDADYDPDMAVGQIITTSGLKAIYGTYYVSEPVAGQNFVSMISMKKASGSPPDYTWDSNWTPILGHEGTNQLPWVIDAHLFENPSDKKLWMTWGGHDLYVSELNATTGYVIDANGTSLTNPEINNHPAGTHTMIVKEQQSDNPDDWRELAYQEGPALYKYGDYYYYMASFGSMQASYTIRMGRASAPRGPYLDRNGTSLLNGGGSFLLGDDKNQLIVGHPHIWEESGSYYMGYDFRTEKKAADTGTDYMGIRQIHWVDGWPTVWFPVTVSFNSSDFAGAVGNNLKISLRHSGDANSVLAIDRIQVHKVSN